VLHTQTRLCTPVSVRYQEASHRRQVNAELGGGGTYFDQFHFIVRKNCLRPFLIVTKSRSGTGMSARLADSSKDEQRTDVGDKLFYLPAPPPPPPPPNKIFLRYVILFSLTKLTAWIYEFTIFLLSGLYCYESALPFLIIPYSLIQSNCYVRWSQSVFVMCYVPCHVLCTLRDDIR
jgi:hypothetical protein